MTDQKQLLGDYLKRIDVERKYDKLFLLMFYSPKDIEYSIGWDVVRNLIISEKIIQKHNIKNKDQFKVDARLVYIKDLKG